MHILLVCNTLTLGGAERYTIDLANSLVDRGIEVTIAHEGPALHEPGPVDAVKHLEISSFRRIKRLGPLRLIVDFSIGKKIYRYSRDNSVDIVNTTFIGHGVWGWLP